MSAVDEVLARCHTDSVGCWVWSGPTNHKGYGYAAVAGRRVRVHRFVYEALVGPIPSGLVLDHLCRNRLCANPKHLEPVTNRENLLRGETIAAKNAAKTTCPQGHPYDAVEGTFRRCRTCARARWRESYQRRKANPSTTQTKEH